MPSTSTLGPGVPVSGSILSIGNGMSPDTYTQIANACEIKLPVINETTDVTNFGDFFRLSASLPYQTWERFRGKYSGR